MVAESPGRPTLRDIADVAGVSVATVSRALTQSTFVDSSKRERVLDAAASLGYRRPGAAPFAPTRSRMLGVIMVAHEGDRQVPHPLFQPVLEGLKRRSELDGYHLLHLSVHERDRDRAAPSYLEIARLRNLDGCILMGVDGGAPQTRALVRSGIPCVGIDLHLEAGGRTAYVSSDNVTGARLAVRHLQATGRRRIATITGNLDIPPGRDRLHGYRCELQAGGLEYRREYIALGDFFESSGYLAARRLLALPEPPDALFCASDLMAIGAMRAIDEAGLVPGKDVGVVGFDDIEAAGLIRPGLTTLRQNPVDLGAAATWSLLQLIRDEIRSPEPIQLPVRLIVRETTIERPAR
jgi:LacI family transcriptional regulator